MVKLNLEWYTIVDYIFSSILLQLRWSAVLDPVTMATKSDVLDLNTELAETAGIVFCLNQLCHITIRTNADDTPENTTAFYMVLTHVTGGALIDRERKTARINVLLSDNPLGLIEISPQSELTVTDRDIAQVFVRRVGYHMNSASVYFRTRLLSKPLKIDDLTVLKATDFRHREGVLTFAPGYTMEQVIEIDVSGVSASVAGVSASTSALELELYRSSTSLGRHLATVVIVNTRYLRGFTLWKDSQRTLTNTTIERSVGRNFKRSTLMVIP